jgi:hypothetical protein
MILGDVAIAGVGGDGYRPKKTFQNRRTGCVSCSPVLKPPLTKAIVSSAIGLILQGMPWNGLVRGWAIGL